MPITSNNKNGVQNSESTDEEYRSIDKRYNFWKHPSGDEPEVVKGEFSLGRAAGEKTKEEGREKEVPGKMTWKYGFTLSESPEQLGHDSTRGQRSSSPERKNADAS